MTATEILVLVTGMLSGLSLFLFGMNVMSESLTRVAGGQLNGLIEKITRNKYAGWLFGTGLAAFVQSSATSVMVVGLVSSGIMTLRQSAGVLLGANLGTTATAWLLSLNSIGGSFWIELLKPSSFTPFLAIIGVVTLMFTRSDRKKEAASIVVGFAVMMIGMNLISAAMEPLESIPAFKSALLRFTNPVLGVFVGMLCTLVIQSSAGTIGIVQALSMSVGITWQMAVPLVCGAQIGTCLTAVLVSLTSNNNGKRTGLMHLYYNLLRNLPFLLIVFSVNGIVGLPILQRPVTPVTIAAFHSLINIAGSALFLPLSALLVKLAVRTIPFSVEEKQEQKNRLMMLDPILLVNPPFALSQAQIATGMLADTVKEALENFLMVFEEKEDVHRSRVKILCVQAERYAQQIGSYLIKISEKKLQDDVARKLTSLGSTAGDFGEMCGHIASMLGTVVALKKDSSGFSEKGRKDLETLGRAVQEILDTTVSNFELNNAKLAGTIQIYREVITDIQGRISKRHVHRLHIGECRPENNILFTNICLGYERIIDRCDSIAGNILIESQDGPQALEQRQYEVIRELFADKYSGIE